MHLDPTLAAMKVILFGLAFASSDRTWAKHFQPKQELIPPEKPFYSRHTRGYRMALRLSVFVQRFDVPSLNRTHPVNLATNQAKGADSTSVACSCCRAGCIERCSPRSTEAFESNPAGFVVQTSNPQTSIR
jgi:hypothetical protein